VAGQVLVYKTEPARDGRLKAVNLRLLDEHLIPPRALRGGFKGPPKRA
jgi:hypothetical protein